MSLDAYCWILDSSDYNLRNAVAKSKDTPVDLLRALAGDGAPAVRVSAATNVAAPLSMLSAAIHDPDPYVRDNVEKALIRRIHRPRSQWPAAFHDPATRRSVRRLIAATDRHMRVVAAAATDPDPKVRVAAAHNVKCPASAIDILADDPDPDVRAAVQARLLSAATA